MQLRPYQHAAVDALRTKIHEGHRRVALIAPCGAGKTVCFSEVIRAAVAKGKRAVVLAHRRELVNQTVEKLARFGVQASVIMADDERRDDSLPVQVCSIQTLARRAEKPPADVLVYDEAHHACSETSRKLLDAYPEAVVIGATATPWRSDKLGLADMFPAHVVAATPAELIALGALVPYSAYAYDCPDLHKVPITAGDYNGKALELACNTSVLVGGVVKEYLAHTPGKRAAVFAAGIAHSQAIVAEFAAARVPAVHVDCHMSSAERDAALAAFERGDALVISSVGVLTEGWDCPSAEVAILARPTKSLTLHIQMIGRVMRPAPGKERAVIHDHAGNLLRSGLIDDERDYSPAATPRHVISRQTCPLCHQLFTRLSKGRCPHCGEAIAPVEDVIKLRKGQKPKRELIGERIDIDEIRRRRAGVGRQDLSDRDLQRVVLASDVQKRAEYKRLQGLAQRGNWGPWWARNKYREIWGEFPPAWTAEQLAVVPAARFPFVPLAKKVVARIPDPVPRRKNG